MFKSKMDSVSQAEPQQIVDNMEPMELLLASITPTVTDVSMILLIRCWFT